MCLSLVFFPPPQSQIFDNLLFSLNCIFTGSSSTVLLNCVFSQSQLILVCSHGHVENQNGPAVPSAASFPRLGKCLLGPAAVAERGEVAWYVGFAFKMQNRETCSGEESLQMLPSLNKVQKSSCQADCVSLEPEPRTGGPQASQSTSSGLTLGVRSGGERRGLCPSPTL